MMVFFVVKDVGDRASSRRVREPRGPWSDDGVGIYGRPAAFRIPDSCKLALPTRRVVCFEKFIADDLARWRVEGPGSRGFSIINRCQYAGIDHHSHLDRHTTIGSFFLENVFPLRKVRAILSLILPSNFYSFLSLVAERNLIDNHQQSFVFV